MARRNIPFSPDMFKKAETNPLFRQTLEAKTPQEIILNLMKLDGRDITDKSGIAHCDVCDTDARLSRGGYIIYRKEETPDYVCERCWNEYTVPKLPSLDSECRRSSYRYGIGRPCDTDDVHELDRNKTLNDNILHARANPEVYGQAAVGFTWVVTTKGKNNKFPEKPITDEDAPKAFCNNCCVLFEKSNLKLCKRCHMVRYCGKECQSAHWGITHKKSCKPRIV
jgi:hypothetical protein